MWGHLPYRAEIYIKIKFFNDSGQERSDWKLDRMIKCDFMPSRAEERLVGRVQNPTSFLKFTNDINVKNDNQIRNIKDRYDTVIDEGPFNVIGIREHRGWSRMSHLTINSQKVLS